MRHPHRFAAAAAAVLLSLAALQPAMAQSRRELAERIDALESRLEVAEQRLLTGDPAAVRLQQRVDELEGQLLNLNGSLEEARNQNRVLRDQMSLLRRRLELNGVDVGDFGDFSAGATGAFSASGEFSGASVPSGVLADGGFATLPNSGSFDAAGTAFPNAEITGSAFGDIDRSAERSLEAARDNGSALTPALSPDETASASFGATYTVILPDDPGEALDVAKRLLIEGRFDEAESAFAQFIARFPDDPLVGEAYYWEGETYAVRGDYTRAASAYAESLARFPDGDRAPDAMIGLAAALAANGATEDACGTLALFDAQYPQADAALRRKADRARDAAGCR